MDKDKSDRFFIPIAEEYIKSGMLDEAIDVLNDGLQRYPNYLGARVSLGKVYLEKGLIHEALREFENVVQVSPDNLFAYRKLVAIYKELGRIDDAIKSCETVLVFSPKDQDITDILSGLLDERNEILRSGEAADAGDAGDAADAADAAEESAGYTDMDSVSQPAGSNMDFTATWEVETTAVQEDQPQEHELPEEPGIIEEEFITETMGDLFIEQGDRERGADVFRRILEKEPDNESVKIKLTDLTVKDKSDHRIEKLQDFLARIERNKR